MSVLDKIKEKINAADKILIITHENPDGDAVGSSLGFMHGLKKLNKEVTVLIPEINKVYSFLPGFDEIKNDISEDELFDLCIALDASNVEILKTCQKHFDRINNSIVIDHHVTNQNYGDVNYVNAIASSTCQNIIVILAALEVAINKDMAECIYTGILTDTGGFRYNVASETFEFVAMLLEVGIDIAKIYRLMFDITTENKIRLLGRALNTLKILNDGKIAVTYILKKDMEELDCVDGDQESIVNYGRNIEGVEVSVFIKEKDDGFKISMRANEYVDVSVIAAKYAGGGHKRAAGCELNMDLEQAKNMIVSEIEKQLK